MGFCIKYGIQTRHCKCIAHKCAKVTLPSSVQLPSNNYSSCEVMFIHNKAYSVQDVIAMTVSKLLLTNCTSYRYFEVLGAFGPLQLSLRPHQWVELE